MNDNLYSGPTCPKCGAATRRRESRNGPFWACTRYPDCKGSMDYFEYTPGMDVTQTAAWKRARRAYGLPCGEVNMEVVLAQAAKPTPAMVEAATAAAEVVKVERKPAKKMDLSKLQKVVEHAGVVVEKPFNPSPYQQAIFDWVESTNDRAGKDVDALMVEALAGSGKTTTAVQMMKHIPQDQSVVFCAFNKHIADALQKRAPKNAKVATTHSLGLGVCMKAFGAGTKVDSNGDKMKAILEGLLDKQTHRHLYGAIKQLVSLVKATLSGDSDEDLEYLGSRYGVPVEVDDKALVYQAVRIAMTRCANMTGMVDFDDMVWLPVRLQLPAPQYDVVIIDEAQDINRSQMALLLSSVKPNGRIIAVGDRYQSIYGFRGADTESIPRLISTLDMDVLPLSITYRNPKSVVGLVNERFPEIPLQAADWAKDGDIQHLKSNEAIGLYAEGDMVLCRTNAPLVGPVFHLIRKGVKAVIRGRDIGKGLVALMDQMECTDTYILVSKLEEYRISEVGKLMAADKTNQAQALVDKVETLIALCDGSSSTFEVKTKISTIFSDDQAGVTFSSVHRAKGLEAERVFILKPELMPHPMAKSDWEQAQEKNIEYVALTRTLSQLYFVMGDE